MRKGMVKEIVAGLVVAVAVAVPTALATAPAHAVDGGGWSPPTDMGSLLGKGYVCQELRGPVPGAPSTWLCFPPNGGPIYQCANPSVCWPLSPGQTVKPKTGVGTGLVTTPTGAQAPTKPTAGTGVLVKPVGALPTATSSTSAGNGVLLTPVDAQTTTTTSPSPTTTIPIDSRAAVRVPTGLVLAR
jgi:hypothetical protein